MPPGQEPRDQRQWPAFRTGHGPRRPVLGTIARIQQAAEQLRYQPNALARGLRRPRLSAVVVTTDSFGRLSVRHAGRGGRARPRADLGIPVRQPGRPDQERRLPAHPARTAGRRHHRDRTPPGAPGGGRSGPRRLRDDLLKSARDLSLAPDDAEGGWASRCATCSAPGGPGHGGRWPDADSRRPGCERRARSRPCGDAGLERGAMASGPRSGAIRRPTVCSGGAQGPGRGLLHDQIAPRGVADAMREAGKRVPEDIALVASTTGRSSRPPASR